MFITDFFSLSGPKKCLVIQFAQFQPSHALLIKFVFKLRQAFAFLCEFLYGELSAAELRLQQLLLVFELLDVGGELLKLSFFLVAHAASGVVVIVFLCGSFLRFGLLFVAVLF